MLFKPNLAGANSIALAYLSLPNRNPNPHGWSSKVRAHTYKKT